MKTKALGHPKRRDQNYLTADQGIRILRNVGYRYQSTWDDIIPESLNLPHFFLSLLVDEIAT